MKIKFIIFTLFKLVSLNTDIFELFNQLNSKNDEEFNNINNNIFKNYFENSYGLYEKPEIHLDLEYIIQLSILVYKYTNLEIANKMPELETCVNEVNGDKNGTKNYLNIVAYSGKDISDLGLEDECLRADFSYFLVVYGLPKNLYPQFKNQNNSFMFFQQDTFFTGLCLPKECAPIINFFFNETLNPAFFTYLRNNLNFSTARVYEVGSLNLTRKKNAEITYDDEGGYSEKKTYDEKKKNLVFKIFFGFVIAMLSFQLLVGIIFYYFCRTVDKTREFKKEIENEENNEEEVEDGSNQIFEDLNQKEEKKIKSCDNNFSKFLRNYFSLFKNMKILLKKKNKYYDSTNLGVITFFRILSMLLLTFINNFEVLIKIPSKLFFYESNYTNYTTVFLKLTSFSVDIWICLDGFEMMYKLITFYKKYIYNNQNHKIFSYICIFFLCSLYKIFSFFIIFFIVNYMNKHFIHLLTENTLFEYYCNHIYNKNLNDEALFKYLIPGYSFYFSYKNKISIFDNLYISKFSLLIINEFYAYIFLLLFFYLSVIIKSIIFDYSILILNFGLYFANNWIISFADNKQYYSYKLAIDNFFTTRYPHIIFVFFFLGAMAALTCFYYKDSFLSDSICNEQNKYPFRFCYKSIRFFDCLMQKGRKLWVFFFFLIQVGISLSFYFLVLGNNDKIYIPLELPQRIVACYESGIFVLLFCIILILIIFIRSENEEKEINKSTIINLIERTNFVFFHTINLLMYTFYCFFNFQVKYNIQNLFIVAFGLFFVVCFLNIILTLAFVLPLKVANKNIIKMYLSDDDDRIETLSQSSIDFDKPLIRDTTFNSIIKNYNSVA